MNPHARLARTGDIRSAVTAIALAVSVLMVSGCTFGPRGPEYVESSTTTIDVGEQTRLEVENLRGLLRLVEGEPGTLEIEAVKRVRARTRSRAAELAGEIEVEVLREGDAIRVVVSYPRKLRGSQNRVVILGVDASATRGEVELTLALPAGMPVSVETRSGDLDVEDHQGDIEFTARSGDIRLGNLVGDLVIHTRSGDLWADFIDGNLDMTASSGDASVRKITGNLRFEATSGDLELGDVGGDLTISTSSGDVEASTVRGALRVGTTSGDVQVGRVGSRIDATTASGDFFARMTLPLDDVLVRTSSGDVTLVVVEPLRGRLNLRTSTGEIAARLPMSMEDAGRGRLIAILGPGDQSIDIRTASGDIDVHLAESE